MRYANELKVGIVLLVGLTVIIFGYFTLRGAGLGADFYYLKLNGVAQIAPGNDVRLQGVKIGQVQEVGFDIRQKPVLTLVIRRKLGVKLFSSYSYNVQSAGLVGENYVDIRGLFKPGASIYPANDQSKYIQGKAIAGLAGVTDDAQEIVKKLDKTLNGFNRTLTLINDGFLNRGNQQKLSQTLNGVSQLSTNASKAFGPQGFRFGFGDATAQRNLNRTLANLEQASRVATSVSRNIEAASRNASIASKNVSNASLEGQNLIHDLRGNLNGVLGDNRSQLQGLITNLTKASNNIAGVTETLDFTLRQGGFKDNAQLVFQSLRRTAENIEVATGGLRKLGEDPNTQTNLSGTLTALRESSEALRDTVVSVKKLVGDEKTGNQLSGVLTGLNTTAQNLAATTEGIKNIIGDTTLQSDVKGAAANLNGTLEATRSAAERVNALLGGRRTKNRTRPATTTTTGISPAGTPTPDGTPGANETPAPTGSKNPKAKVEDASAFGSLSYSLTLRHFVDKPDRAPGRNFGDLGLDAELFGSPFRLGLSNIGDGTDFTAQTGHYLGPHAAVRYGLYRSDLGAGIELRKGKLSLESNVWDLNKGNYNVYGGLQITPQLQIIAGRDSYRGDAKNSVGIRLTH